MITVTMTREQWGGVIRLMREGADEGEYYVGRDDEVESLISSVCGQAGITQAEAEDMAPPRDYYVPKGDAP